MPNTTFDLETLNDFDFDDLPDQVEPLNITDPVQPAVVPTRTVVEQSLDVDPDQHSQKLKLSDESGFSRQFVEAAPDEIERKVAVDKLIPAGSESTHPVTNAFISDLDNAIMARDDISALRELEDYITKPREISIQEIANEELKLQDKSGLVNNIQGFGERTANLFGGLYGIVDQVAAELQEVLPSGAILFTDQNGEIDFPRYVGADEWNKILEENPNANLIKRTSEILKETDFGHDERNTLGSVSEAFENGTLGETVSETISLAISTTTQSLPDIIGAAVALPGYVASRSNELGDIRAENKGLVESTLRETIEAAPGAIGSAILERILPNKIFKTKTQSEFDEIGKTILEKVSNVSTRTVEGVVIEAGTEFVQEGIIEYLTERVGTDADIDVREALLRGGEAAVLGGLSGGLLSGSVTTVQETVNGFNQSTTVEVITDKQGNIISRTITVVKDLPSKVFTDSKDKLISKVIKQSDEVNDKADNEARQIEALGEQVQGIKLNQRSPEAFKKFIEQADGDKNSQVYIDGPQVKLYLQGKDILNDPVLQTLNEQVNEAALTGADISIPVGEAAALFADTEHFNALKDSITLSADTVPQFRKEQAVEETRKFANRIVAESTGVESQYVEAQEIAETVRTQLIDSGRVEPRKATIAAQIAPAWAVAYAQREDISVKEAYERSGLTIQGPLTGEKAKLADREANLDGKLKQDKSGVKGTFDPVTSIIELSESSDLSTFLHEFGHFIYEQELTANNEASKQNIKAIHKWITRNIKDVAKNAGTFGDKKPVSEEQVTQYIDSDSTGDIKTDEAIQTAIHEYVAEGFEKYLMEGKAPSVELRNAFSSFARWLTQIYRGVQGALGINLDDDARAIFDRLLATEEQIEAAEARAQYEPKITDAVLAGMTEEQYEAYKANQEQVKDKQSETLRDKLLSAIRGRIKAEQSEKFKEIVADEKTKLADEKVYRIIQSIKTGDFKLDLAETKAIGAQEIVNKNGKTSRRLPGTFNGLTISGKRGVHPDTAAGFFGFTSGAELVDAISNVIPINKQAELNAKERLREEFGDPLNDGTVEAEADEAIRVEGRGELLIKELAALRRQNNDAVIKREEIKRIADQAIGKLGYTQIHPRKYRAAELRAAQEAARMEAVGNLEGAAQAKSTQLLNYYLGVAATNARADIEKIVDFTARYRKKSVREEIQKAGPDTGYWDQITKILGRFEFRKSATIKSTEQVNVDGLQTWSTNRELSFGDSFVIDPYVLEETNVTHWKNVPFDQLQGVKDTLVNIEHNARETNRITLRDEQLTYQEAKAEWLSSIAANNKVRRKFVQKRRSASEGKDWFRWIMAGMTKISYLASDLDGGERGGISHDMLFQRFTDAQSDKLDTYKEVVTPVIDAINNRSKEDVKRHNQLVSVPEMNSDEPVYVHNIIAMALNTGNQENLEKMMIGEGWVDVSDKDTITRDNEVLNAAFKHLTKSDWELVQTIWDQMELLYPRLAEVHRKSTGLVPPKVNSQPFTNEHGTFQGGYYPLVADSNRSRKAEENEHKLQETLTSQFGTFGSIHASAKAGATNERTKAYYPIRLSLDVVPNHFAEVIHYVTHHEAVKQTNKLINDPDIQNAISDRLGPEEQKLLKPWLKDIATDGREAKSKEWFEDVFKHLKNGTTLGVMGFNPTTAVIQGLGLSNAVAEVGVKNMAYAVRKVLGSEESMGQAYDFAVSNSKILKHRVKTMDREMQSVGSELQGKDALKSGRNIQDGFGKINNNKVLKKIRDVSMKHIAYTQLYAVDLPTWYGAYKKEMDLSGDEQKAFRVADLTVESIQGSGSMKDMSAIMRSQNTLVQTMTMFMTFFSAYWNFQRDTVKGAIRGNLSWTDVAARAAFAWGIPVIVEEYLRSFITGALTDDEEENDPQLEEMLLKSALYPTISVPFLRDAANSATSGFGYQMSPVGSLIDRSLTGGTGALSAAFDDDKDVTQSQAENIFRFTGAVLNIPGTGELIKMNREARKALVEGEDFMLNQFFFGEPPKK